MRLLCLLWCVLSIACSLCTATNADTAGAWNQPQAALQSEGAAMLSSMLHPMSLDTFFSAYWERNMTLQSHQLAGHSSRSGGGNEGWFRGEVTDLCWTRTKKINARLEAAAEDESGWTLSRRVCERVKSHLNLEMEMSDLALMLDSGGSAFEPLRHDGAVTRFSNSDLRLVKRVLAADGELWTAAVPLAPASQVIDSRLVRAGLSRGFTLVLNRVNYRHAAIAHLCSALQRDVFGFRVQANLYVTPANSSGFEAHFDWQQSFVLQLQGAKRWTLMEPPIVQLPRSDMKFKPTRAGMAGLRRDHRLLETGSTLYFPAGMIHEATTAALESHSDDASGRDALHAEAADLANQQPDLASAPSSTQPLPLSMHLTLGVEIDPAFTMQGLLHVLIDRMQHEAEYAERLLAPIAAAVGQYCSMPPLSSSSPVRVLDLLQLIVLSEASSRVDSHAHKYRRSLLGLHSWSDRTGSLFAAGLARDHEGCMRVWSHHNATQHRAQCFAWRVEDQLYELMKRLDVITPSTVYRAAAYAEQHQQRIRTAADARAGTSAASPSPQAYEFESLFSDALLSPLVQPALESRGLIRWLIAQFAEPRTPCADALAHSVNQLFGLLSLFDWPCPLDTHPSSVPYDPMPLRRLLSSSLLILQQHLEGINAQQRTTQQAYLRSNVDRARLAQQQMARQFGHRSGEERAPTARK